MDTAEDVDVLIAGAGISGIGAAYHLQLQCPGRRFVLLEAQAGFGGTWRTHRYPGIRSDSDLFTFGLPPQAEDGQADRHRAGDPALRGRGHRRPPACAAHPLRPYPHRRTLEQRGAALAGRATPGDSTVHVRARLLWMCQGYYRHASGYLPRWPGMEDFSGRIVHPQDWPDDLDLNGRQVVVIGSGAKPRPR